MSEFTRYELDLLRQWFGAVEDTGATYLEARDYDLADKIAAMLDAPNPRRPARLAAPGRDGERVG